MNKESPSFLKTGGICGLAFSAIWLVCTTGYCIQAGFPSSPPSLTETAEMWRRSTFKLLFWAWPIAYLAVIPFALAVKGYLSSLSPVSARIGSAFLLLYSGLWFVYYAVLMTAISLVQSQPVNESQFSLLLSIVWNLASPIFWAIVIWMGSWAVALIKRKGLELLAGWVFALSAVSSVVYFIMRFTGPYRPAEIVHEFLIIFMIVGVSSLSISMIQKAGSSSQTRMGEF